jgi:hypothetical protein
MRRSRCEASPFAAAAKAAGRQAHAVCRPGTHIAHSSCRGRSGPLTLRLASAPARGRIFEGATTADDRKGCCCCEIPAASCCGTERHHDGHPPCLRSLAMQHTLQLAAAPAEMHVRPQPASARRPGEADFRGQAERNRVRGRTDGERARLLLAARWRLASERAACRFQRRGRATGRALRQSRWLRHSSLCICARCRGSRQGADGTCPAPRAEGGARDGRGRLKSGARRGATASPRLRRRLGARPWR